MPLYEYECRSCNARFEHLVLNKSTEVKCRSCGSSEIAQLLSVFSVAGTSDHKPVDPGPCGSCGAAQRGQCQFN